MLLLVRVLPALGCVAAGIRIHDFLCRAAATTFTVSPIVAGATTLSTGARRTGRIEDRTCPTGDELQASVGDRPARRLGTRTRRSTHPPCRMPRIDENWTLPQTPAPRQSSSHTGGPVCRPCRGALPTFQVDFFRWFCVESCDFLRKAWPRRTAGPMRFGVLRARPETATSSGFAEALSEQFGPLPVASGEQGRNSSACRARPRTKSICLETTC